MGSFVHSFFCAKKFVKVFFKSKKMWEMITCINKKQIYLLKANKASKNQNTNNKSHFQNQLQFLCFMFSCKLVIMFDKSSVKD